jgi:sulfate transport system substrate-binding protein
MTTMINLVMTREDVRGFLAGALVAVLLLGGTVTGLTLLGTRPALLNVSYDPTRELWVELNEAFAARNPGTLRLQMSHGGSSAQARAVLDGLRADVVTLALWSDVDALRAGGLIADGWEERYPPPYFSTIVFVVRAGNPKGIQDWPDLIREGVQVITPNPKTSGNGKLSFLAAWGAIQTTTGSEEQARDYVRALYQHVPVLDSGARSATLTFAQKKVGDVQITWENEAHLELKEYPGELEIVYPARSIRAEPPVAIVDKVVERKGTRDLAEAYLKFLYTDEGQEIIARHHYRPANAAKDPRLFGITDVVPGGWGAAQDKFFGSKGEYDRLTAK